MLALSGFYRFLSIDIWGGLPSSWQKAISKLYTSIYNTPWSKHIIEPYCRHYYDDPGYLKNFVPASGESTYQTFQDFFSRKLSKSLDVQGDYSWPAEGLLCEYGKVSDLDLVNVKGEKRHLRMIFGSSGVEISNEYFFSNIFLHNNNYHRIHAPVSGRISKIERISGDLVLLRPWVYKKDPSLPALRNERVNIDIVDTQGRTWFLSIVGGPAVGSIQVSDGVTLGTDISAGEELSIFLLGSTCCMAAPIPCKFTNIREQVCVGEQL